MTEPMVDTINDPLQAILAAAPANKSAGKWLRRLLFSGAVVAAVVYWQSLPPSSDSKYKGRYITEAAVISNLVVTVSATGTLQPTRSVNVGSEQSGTLIEVMVQENDLVKKGQLLAKLDTAKLKDTVNKSKAALAVAKAAVALAQATVAEAKANLARMRQVAKLSDGQVPSQAELETAAATVKRAIASEDSARASVAQAQSALKTDETNLSKGTIRSPVNGVVLMRSVEPGQTVVASMSTPTLFTLAEDLTSMELQVQVDEADVGNVKLGQKASFTVAAWPGVDFPAIIQRIGIGSTITDNVVTYKTILAVRNNDLELRPGMTATASIITAERNNALLVPNAALRFTPPDISEEKSGGSLLDNLLPRPPRERKKRLITPSSTTPQIWVLDSVETNTPRMIEVKTGVSNGRLTEITGGDLKQGMAVITDYQEPKR